jgi:hypothetical protein
MVKITKGYIEYCGLPDKIPELDTPGCFKEFLLQGILTLPEADADIGIIIKVTPQVFINDTRIVKTIEASSEEGQTLTGRKMIVEGRLIQEIEYAELSSACNVHASHFDMPFAMSIILPADHKSSLPMTAAACIDDIWVKPVDKRSIYYSVSILLTAHSY